MADDLLRSNLKSWTYDNKGQSPLDFLGGIGKGMPISLEDMWGVNHIKLAKALKYYGALGVTDPQIPKTIFANPEDNPDLNETLAHESEHSRQHQASFQQQQQMLNPGIGLSGLHRIAEKLPGYGSVQSQPNNGELLAFLRGKEHTGEVKPSDYDTLNPHLKQYVLSNMFLGKDKWLPPGPETSFQGGARQGPSLLDMFRQKMRAFTSY